MYFSRTTKRMKVTLFLMSFLMISSISISDGTEFDIPATITCGDHFVRVEGWAVYTASDGSEHPVRRLKIYSGYYVDGSFKGKLTKITAKTRKSGYFSFQATVPYSVREGTKGGLPCKEEIYLSNHYLFRAKDCEDLIVEVSKDWQKKQVHMALRGSIE